MTRHGRLLGVVGTPRRAGEFHIAPALVEIDAAHCCHPLAAAVGPAVALAVGAADGFETGTKDDPPPDALWVRSRLPGAFGYRPLHVGGDRPGLLDAGFVAVLDAEGDPAIVPFACRDEEFCGSTLVMSRREDAGVRRRVAGCFCGLLADVPGADFRCEGFEGCWGWSDDEDVDDRDPLLTEVGRWRGRYYRYAAGWGSDLDPNIGRPDWSPGTWSYEPSRPVRRVRRVRRCW